MVTITTLLNKYVLVVAVMIGSTYSLIAATKSGPPRITGTDVTAVVGYEGDTLQLTCKVSGDPFPAVTWFKNGHLILGEWRRYSHDRTNLIISEVQKSDEGTFVCEAVNGFGKQHITVQVNVIDKRKAGRSYKLVRKPVFSQPVKMRQHNILANYGSNIRLRCKAKGKPKPNIEWFKDGNLTSVGFSSNSTKSRWTLTLLNVTPNNDGKYTCRVWNVAGEITFQYSVHVLGQIRDSPVLLEPHPVNTSVVLGERASIQCHVRSPVSPTIKWIKRLDKQTVQPRGGELNKALVIEEKSYLILPEQEMMRLPDGTYLNKLLIKRAAMRDAGMYICFGANTMGYNFRYAYLTVLPDKSSSKLSNNLPRNLNSGGSVSLLVIIGIPAGIGLLVACVITMYCFFNQQIFGKHSSFNRKSDIDNADEYEVAPILASRQNNRRSTIGVSEGRKVTDETIIQVVDKTCSSVVNFNPTTDTTSASRPVLSMPSISGYVEMTIHNGGENIDSESGFSSSYLHRTLPPPPPPPSQYSTSSSPLTGNRQRHRYTCHCTNQCHHHRNCGKLKRHNPLNEASQ